MSANPHPATAAAPAACTPPPERVAVLPRDAVPRALDEARLVEAAEAE